MKRANETYLGDGLYASLDPGRLIKLRAPRALGVDHWVGLEPEVFLGLCHFAARIGWGNIMKRALENLKQEPMDHDNDQ
jgi:hypothetical protein